MMTDIQALQPGDMVICVRAIHNDGSFPDCADDALLVQAGQRGVVINIGHLEAEPEQHVFLVRFEMPPTGELGPEIGCWPLDIAAAV